MKDWQGTTHVYGNLKSDAAEAIAPLIVNALSMSNYTRMALIVDTEKRVLLVQERSKLLKETTEKNPTCIGPVYRCGRNPARIGLTPQRIAEDIRETAG